MAIIRIIEDWAWIIVVFIVVIGGIIKAAIWIRSKE